MKISILTDNKSSWFVSYAKKLNDKFNSLGHSSNFITNKEDIEAGDICFLLSCIKILPDRYLELNDYNIVIHASDLPKGKGFSPLQWQILEGNDNITLTLFNAVSDLDAGDYFFKDTLCFEGHELLDELHCKMGGKIMEMAEKFVNDFAKMIPKKQQGQSSFYPQRTEKDDMLDPSKSIIENFNHLRIANNKDYPLFFEYKGCKYNLKIEKRND